MVCSEVKTLAKQNKKKIHEKIKFHLFCLGFTGFEANSDIEELFAQDLDLYFTIVCSQETTLAKKIQLKTKPKTPNYTGDWDWFGFDCL
jgi:uncharacterized protein (DUF1810 family)